MVSKNIKPGATGKFPQGKLYEDDEGELAVAISTDKQKGLLLLNFGKSISWLAMRKEEAQALIDMLNEKIKEM